MILVIRYFYTNGYGYANCLFIQGLLYLLMTQFSEKNCNHAQKGKFLLVKKLEIINKMNNKKTNLGGCHHLLLIYDASKVRTVYVVKSPVLG